MDIVEDLTKRLRNQVDSGKVGVRELGRETGLPPETISRIINGHRKPTAEQMAILAEWLGTRLTK